VPAVLASVYSVGQAQADGRAYVTETHTDQYAIAWSREYLAAAGADYAALLAQHAAQVEAAIEALEINAELQLGAPLTLKYTTKAQLGNAFRARYQTATKDEACRLAKWLLDHIDAGDFTDAQVQAFFGLTAAQYTAMKARASSMRDAYNAMLAAVGE
jgi:hypothetical protein